MENETGQGRTRTRGESARSGVLDNPLDFIAEDHMREREVCALIDRLVMSGELDPQEKCQILTFLEVQLPHHLEDEEIDLFPMMLKRCEPEDEIDKVIGKLESDHSHAAADTPEIIAIVRKLGVSTAKLTSADCSKMADFADHARRHLVVENAIILPIARGRLTGPDLRRMRHHMLERRGLPVSVE